MQKIVPDVYHKYIYVQTMKDPGKHNLTRGKSNEVKLANKGQLAEIEKVQSQLSFACTHEQFYLFKGFHSLPHGSSLQSNRADAEARLSEAGVPFRHYSPEDGHTILTDNVKLFYPGSEEMNAMQRIQLDKKGVLEMILKHGEFAAKKCDDRPTITLIRVVSTKSLSSWTSLLSITVD